MSAWDLPPQDLARARTLAKSGDVPPMVGQALLNRGLATVAQAKRFLSPSLDALDDPSKLPDMPAALRRLRRAVASGERILIFGDSDVDGLTASAIVSELLRSQGVPSDNIFSEVFF